jgi:uncharacterized protein YggE
MITTSMVSLLDLSDTGREKMQDRGMYSVCAFLLAALQHRECNTWVELIETLYEEQWPLMTLEVTVVFLSRNFPFVHVAGRIDPLAVAVVLRAAQVGIPPDYREQDDLGRMPTKADRVTRNLLYLGDLYRKGKFLQDSLDDDMDELVLYDDRVVLRELIAPADLNSPWKRTQSFILCYTLVSKRNFLAWESFIIYFCMANPMQSSFWPEWKSNKLFTVLLGILMVYGIVWLFVQIDKTIAEADNVGIADQMPASITVTAEGNATQKPDQAEVNLSIMMEGTTSNEAQDANSVKMNALLAKMKELGLKDADLQTSQYNLYPTYNYDVSPAVITGYQATQSLTVTMSDTSLGSVVLAAAGDLGVTSIGQLQLTVSDTTLVEQEARTEAIAKAYVQAANIARAMGQKVGAVVSYYESAGSMPYPYYGLTADSKAIGGGPEPTIAEGTNESIIDVTITYGLK